MIPIPAILLSVVFLFLSALHFFWALGGTWGFENAIPKKNGVPLFTPGKIATVFIALALLSAAVVPLWRAGFLEPGPVWLSHAATWAIAGVFAIRAVGDFRYCGFFKRIRGTAFARNDSLIFSPLCAFLSTMAIWLSLSY